MSVCGNNTDKCYPYTLFKGVSSISDDFLLNIIETNFKSFFDWAFINIGGWFDAQIGDYNFYSSSNYNHSKLTSTHDTAYIDGQVWQGMRKDWVWETGCGFGSTDPISISGIYINNILTTTGYHINYPDGKIVFDTARAITSDIQVNHSYRNVQVYRANDAPWFSTIQYGSFDTSNIDINRTADGEWSIAGNHRIQLPAIVIESVPRSRSRPFEIGSDKLLIEQDIAFYVLAENKNDRNKLLDILRLQQDSTIILYNTNEVAKADKYPLDHNGSLKSNPMMYPNLTETYPWRKCSIKNVNLFEIDNIHPNFYQGLARATVEIIST